MKIILVVALLFLVSCDITAPVRDEHLAAQDYININKISISTVVYTPYLPYYSQIFATPEKQNVIHFTLENRNSRQYYNVMLEGYIDGISSRSVVQEYINPNQTVSLGIRPVIAPEIASQIFENREVVYRVTLKVAIGDTVFHPIFHESYNITLTPHNTAVFEFLENGEAIDARDYLAIWSTPNIREIDTFLLNDVASRHPQRSIVGYQDLAGQSRNSIVMEQVRAIYNSIASLGILYVNNFLSFSGNQKIKFPKQVLNSQTANCIESTMLFASVLEAVGLQPIVITTQSHAFVGWRMWEDSDEMGFLETVFALNYPPAPFEAAVDEGTMLYEQELDMNHFNTGDAYLLDIGEIRERGVTPFPLARRDVIQ